MRICIVFRRKLSEPLTHRNGACDGAWVVSEPGCNAPQVIPDLVSVLRLIMFQLQQQASSNTSLNNKLDVLQELYKLTKVCEKVQDRACGV